MGKKHTTKWLLGIIVVLLLGVVVIGSTTNYLGSFNFKNGPLNQSTDNWQKAVDEPILDVSIEGSIAVLLEVKTDTGYVTYSHDGYDSLGSWQITVTDDGDLCESEMLKFQLLDYSKGLYDLSEVFDDIRLNVTSGDAGFATQIDDGIYYEADSATLSEFPGDYGMSTGDTQVFFLSGIVKDGIDWSGEADDEKKVYITQACASDLSGNTYTWSHNDADGENEYFETDNAGTGYGVPGSRTLPY